MHPGPLVQILRFLPGFVLRRFYPPEKIAQKILIEFSSSGEGLSFYKSEQYSSIRGWLIVTNLSPFPIEIDRILGEIFVGGRVADVAFLQRTRVKPSSTTKLLFEIELTANQVKRIEWNISPQCQPVAPEIGFEIKHAYLITKVTDVVLFRRVATGNYSFANFPKPDNLSN
jgi:hypothetical protein